MNSKYEGHHRATGMGVAVTGGYSLLILALYIVTSSLT